MKFRGETGGSEPGAIDHFRQDYVGQGDLRETGFGGTEEEWKYGRGLIVEVIDRDGSFLDLGCANGRLAADVQKWAEESGKTVDVFGADFVPELITRAQQRFPAAADHFQVADVSTFDPGRTFTYVRTEMPYFPPEHLREHLQRYLDMIEPGGALIITKYDDNTGTEFVEFADVVRGLELGETEFRFNDATSLGIVHKEKKR